MSCHSAVSRYGPSPKELQKSSQNESSRQVTLARRETDEAKEHVMNRSSQSSTAPAQTAHSAGASGIKCWRRDLVRRRLRSKSQAKTRIFIGTQLFHIRLHLLKMQNPLAPPSPEGTYRRLERRKEARTKSTHLACPMVADRQVALEAGEDPLPAGRIVLRVRPEPMRRARLD